MLARAAAKLRQHGRRWSAELTGRDYGFVNGVYVCDTGVYRVSVDLKDCGLEIEGISRDLQMLELIVISRGL